MEQETSLKNTYEVTVAGLPLKLKSSHDKEKVEKLVDLVNRRVDEAVQKNGASVSFQKALVITCLELADELLTLSDSTKTDLLGLEKKAKQILDILDSPVVAQMGQ